MPSKRGLIRGGIVAALVPVLGLVGVHVYNFVRMDLGTWRSAGQPLVQRAQAISERAGPEYQDLALATLPPNPPQRIVLPAR
jgi:hypothetical protein